MKYDVIIIGSGPSGLTAALYNSRADLKTLVLAGQKWGGQLMLTTDVENYPGFPEGIQGPELMDKMRKQAERFHAEVKDEQVTNVDFTKPRKFSAKTNKATYTGKAIIVATGADTRWLGIPGEQELIGRGVSSCAPCDAFFYKDKKVIVVGGGDSAMEEALVLTKFAKKVTVIHRRDQFRASKIMADRVLTHPKIKVLWNTEVVEVLGKDKVTAVKVKTTQPEEEILKIFARAQKINKSAPGLQITNYVLPTDGLFVAIGHIPNTKLFQGKLELDAKGNIVRHQIKDTNGVVKYTSATSVAGVFVAGDVHDYTYRQAITAAGFGCMAAMDVERWLDGVKNHKGPGIGDNKTSPAHQV